MSLDQLPQSHHLCGGQPHGEWQNSRHLPSEGCPRFLQDDCA